MRLLIVEDEIDLANALARGLRRDGYAVDVATDGAEASIQVETHDYDLMLLDLSLPGLEGTELLLRARASRPHLLVLVVTARGRLEERILGLDLGADDYLVKPFHLDELRARIRAVLRRDLRARAPVLQCGDLKLDPAARIAWQGERRLELTRKEFCILEYLMRRLDEVVSQEELIEHVWDAEVDPFTNVVRVHIKSLRGKLGDEVQSPRYIETMIGHGYRLVSKPPKEPA